MKNMTGSKKYISLFSGGGVGDVGFKEAGLEPIILNEIEPQRAQIAQLNFPSAKVVAGDIREVKEEIISLARENTDDLFLISATPPCQGMSKNGIGSILKAIRESKRPKVDDRNYLFLEALELVNELKPTFFFFENVDRMFNTYVLNQDNESVLVLPYIKSLLNSYGYEGDFKKFNFADFGLPQNRRRTVGIFYNKNKVHVNETDIFPSTDGYKKVTLKEAIGKLPKIDSESKEKARSNFHPLHKVPVSRADLYYWIKHTKEGDTAFNNNLCPSCEFLNSKEDVNCGECKTLLPKPVISEGGRTRLIKGYISSYKRMSFDEPSPTITTRFGYAMSDNNVHPAQNRVLSMYEAAVIQGMKPEEYLWGPTISGGKVNKIANDGIVREIIGEAVPPFITQIFARHFLQLSVQGQGINLELPTKTHILK